MSNQEKAHPAIGLLIVVGGSLFLWALIIWAVVSIVGCAKPPPPKTPPTMATSDDCHQVYSRVLAISLVQNLDPDHHFSKEETEAGIRLLDHEYRQSGRTKQFFGYCRSQLNSEQVSCMLGANSFEDMSVCDKMFASK